MKSQMEAGSRTCWYSCWAWFSCGKIIHTQKFIWMIVDYEAVSCLVSNVPCRVWKPKNLICCSALGKYEQTFRLSSHTRSHSKHKLQSAYFRQALAMKDITFVPWTIHKASVYFILSSDICECEISPDTRTCSEILR